MDGYFQSTLAANTLQQNISRNNANNATAQVARVVPHFPPTNKDFSATELHTPDGIYPLLHETFYETIAPQFTTGTRASVVSVKDEHFHLANNESSEDEGLIIGGPSFSMTPAKSAALPIPNAASSKRSLRNTITTSSSTSSIHANNGNGLQVLTSPQKIMTGNGNGNNANPYSPYSTSFSTTPTSQLPPSSQLPSIQHPQQQQQQQQQFASGSYMMSSSQDLGMPGLSVSSTNDYSLPSSFNNCNNPNNTGSVGSLSSLFGKSANPTGARATPQLSSSMVRSMSASFNSNSSSKPKNHLSKTNSTFVLRFLIHEHLHKMISSNELGEEFLFFNIGSSFIWVDSNSRPKVGSGFNRSYRTL
ncbi:hypothetical protein BD408DRAFT_28388 [Parasitella parasitica]|nr:hypothetical protein BD408DRAFT_28388 [Parasitella parasitica]